MVTFEQPVEVTAPATFEVVVDNVSREFRARVGDSGLFLPVELNAIEPPAADGAPSELCLDLTRQL
jgi:hypothetical protein